MNSAIRFAGLLILAALAGCSKTPEPANETTPAAVTPLPAASADVLRADLTADGIATEYAALFATDRLERIIEHRHEKSATLEGEYEFTEARLMRYRGAKLRDGAIVDLQFDPQGALLSSEAAEISDAEVREIRNRAQLLRSHALARRAATMHH